MTIHEISLYDYGRRHTRLAAVVVTLLLLVATTACTVRLIAEYDEVLDKSITDFQTKTETFLAKLQSSQGTPDATYDKNKDYYDQSIATLNTMRVRAIATPKSSIIVQQIDLMKGTIEDFRKLHQSTGAAGLTTGAIDATRSALETQFEAMLKLELALKRGKTARSTVPAPWLLSPEAYQGN